MSDAKYEITRLGLWRTRAHNMDLTWSMQARMNSAGPTRTQAPEADDQDKVASVSTVPYTD
ncbi:hypothetical protein BDZ89DRAFT_1067845, partial [Hymenopellis radicata]